MTEMGAGSASRGRGNGVQDFAASELFDRTFQEGMELVEETATYLDGTGRQDSKLLSRSAALAYAGESMRLTTRLMQLASWPTAATSPETSSPMVSGAPGGGG